MLFLILAVPSTDWQLLCLQGDKYLVCATLAFQSTVSSLQCCPRIVVPPSLPSFHPAIMVFLSTLRPWLVPFTLLSLLFHSFALATCFAAAQAVPAPVKSVTVTVDLAARHPISPWVVGVNFATQTLLDWGVGVSRNSGDAISKYNWKIDYTNSADDFYWYCHTEDHTRTLVRKRDVTFSMLIWCNSRAVLSSAVHFADSLIDSSGRRVRRSSLFSRPPRPTRRSSTEC